MILSGTPDIAQKLLDSLLETEDSIVILIDEGGFIKEVNNQGLLLLDSSKEVITGTHITGLVTEKYKDSFSGAFNKMLETEKPIYFETGFTNPLEKQLLLKCRIVPLFYNDKISEILFSGIDKSRERMLEEKINSLNTRLLEAERLIAIEKERANRRKSILEELNKLKSEFISNISHELRTPLASIIGFSETIASDPDMPDDMKSEFVNIILNEGKRLAKLINDVLDISKVEGGKLELQKTTFDFVQVIKDIIDAQKRSADQKEITLLSELPDSEVLLNADKDTIQQVFVRLLNNAVKFTNNKGRIRVIVRSLFKELEVIISDTGLGIPEKDIPFIFQKFYRVSRPGTEIPGTGLGLVFVKQIVDLHKGLITVQSESGKGTTFVVKLPKSNFLT